MPNWRAPWTADQAPLARAPRGSKRVDRIARSRFSAGSQASRAYAAAPRVWRVVLSPAELHEREMDARSTQRSWWSASQRRRARSARNAALRRQSRVCASEFLAKLREEEEQRAAKERADNDSGRRGQAGRRDPPPPMRRSGVAHSRRPARSARGADARSFSGRMGGRHRTSVRMGTKAAATTVTAISTSATSRTRPWCAKERSSVKS